MRVEIYRCLFAFALGCNVAAEILHKVVKEKERVDLPCSPRVEGDVKWSRETGGSKVDILTVTGDREKKHINDPGKRYGSTVDGTLHIRGANVSDSGKYFCNNETAVKLTVIPSGTNKNDAEEGTNITLPCPPDVRGSDAPTWTRKVAGELQQIRRRIPTVGKTLTIKKLQPGDSGLYYCDGEPAVYLNVTTGWKKLPGLVLGTFIPFLLLLLLLLLLIFVYIMWRRRSKRRKIEDQNPIYEEVQDGPVLKSSNGGSTGPTGPYYMVTFPGRSNQEDPTYTTISDLPPTQMLRPVETPYSYVSNT